MMEGPGPNEIGDGDEDSYEDLVDDDLDGEREATVS